MHSLLLLLLLLLLLFSCMCVAVVFFHPSSGKSCQISNGITVFNDKVAQMLIFFCMSLV